MKYKVIKEMTGIIVGRIIEINQNDVKRLMDGGYIEEYIEEKPASKIKQETEEKPKTTKKSKAKK